MLAALRAAVHSRRKAAPHSHCCSSARGRKSSGASARPSQPQDLARRTRIGPGLRVAGGDLPAVGEAGLERRPRLPFGDHDFVAQLAQEPGAGHPNHTGTEDKDTHVADPQGSDCDRF